MSSIYPIENSEQFDHNQVTLGTDWLSQFHAFGWGQNYETKCGLMAEGSYWYLDTRMEELNTMSDERLKNAAHAVADKLRPSAQNCSKPGWSLVHGDSKLHNFVFSADS